MNWKKRFTRIQTKEELYKMFGTKQLSINVSSPRHSRKVQERLFELGFSWHSDNTDMENYPDMKSIQIGYFNEGILTFSTSSNYAGPTQITDKDIGI